MYHYLLLCCFFLCCLKFHTHIKASKTHSSLHPHILLPHVTICQIITSHNLFYFPNYLKQKSDKSNIAAASI